MTTISDSNCDNSTNKLVNKIDQILSSNKTESQNECNGIQVQKIEIQETLNEDDFVEGLDPADACDDEEKDIPRRRSWDRSRGRDKRNSRYWCVVKYCLY
jgi:hypothetical protein